MRHFQRIRVKTTFFMKRDIIYNASKFIYFM